MRKFGLVWMMFFLTLILMTGAAGLQAQVTWFVDDSGPADPGPGNPGVSDPLEDGSPDHPFDAIQEAVDVSVNGDSILVADGTYTGAGNRDIVYGGRAITLSSMNGPASCVIDCEGSDTEGHRGFHFQNSEDAASVLEGFTIRNGFESEYDGGAIYCYQSSPAIKGNIITDNTSLYSGGAIFCDRGSPLISDNIITDNTAKFSGGAIFLYYSFSVVSRNILTGNVNAGGPSCSTYGGAIAIIQEAPVITRNVISGNSTFGAGWGHTLGGGIAVISATAALITHIQIFVNFSTDGGGGISIQDAGTGITNNLIFGNQAGVYGGGIYCAYASPRIANCTIAFNDGGTNGGGIACYASSSPLVINSILWGDGPDEIYIDDEESPDLNYTNIQGGYKGTGNLNINPFFVDAAAGDFHLRQEPCQSLPLGAGNPSVNGGDPNSSIAGTTRSDAVMDSGIPDMGYHYPHVKAFPSGNVFLEEPSENHGIGRQP